MSVHEVEASIVLTYVGRCQKGKPLYIDHENHVSQAIENPDGKGRYQTNSKISKIKEKTLAACHFAALVSTRQQLLRSSIKNNYYALSHQILYIFTKEKKSN